MQGSLYSLPDPDTNTVATIFMSGSAESATEHLIFVAGLTDRLPTMPDVMSDLQQRLPASVSLVQCQLRSVGHGFGALSIEDDADDLLAICRFLLERGSQSITLMGHSTGSQDCVAFLKKHASSLKGVVHGVILQAPVSDRHYIQSAVVGAESMLRLATDMIDSGRCDDFLPAFRLFGCGVTAARFASLAGRMTPDDLFSTDLTDAELRRNLQHITIPSLWVFSGADEFVPAPIDQNVFAKRIETLFPQSSCTLIDGARHDLSDPDHASRFIDLVIEFLARTSPDALRNQV